MRTLSKTVSSCQQHSKRSTHGKSPPLAKEARSGAPVFVSTRQGRADEMRPLLRDLSAKQGAGQAGGTAAAIDADFTAGEISHIESGLAQSFVRAAIFFDRQQALAA